MLIGLPLVLSLCALSLAAQPARQWVDPSPHRARQIVVQPGTHLEVLDWGGQGQPLVFLAGYGNSAHVFDGFAPGFRDRFRVIGITRRGFGASSLATSGYDNESLARDVIAVLDSLRVVHPILIGHSFAGAELNVFGIQHPGVARALIYLDGGFDFAELYADSAWLKTPFSRVPQRPDGDDSPRGRTAYAAEGTGPGYPEGEVRSSSAWQSEVARTPSFHADSLATWLMRGTPPAALRDIRLPTLAIYGVPATVEQKYPWYSRLSAAGRVQAERRFDVETPRLARQRSRFRNEVPNARIVEIAGGRHYVFLSNPREVTLAIREFVRGLD